MARSPDEPWDIAFSLAGTDGEPLGVDFLRTAPRKVRATMQAVLEAVAEAPAAAPCAAVGLSGAGA